MKINKNGIAAILCILIEVLFVHASHNILKQRIKMKVHWFYKGHILISNTIRCETCKLYMNFVKLKGVLLFIPFFHIMWFKISMLLHLK